MTSAFRIRAAIDIWFCSLLADKSTILQKRRLIQGWSNVIPHLPAANESPAPDSLPLQNIPRTACRNSRACRSDTSYKLTRRSSHRWPSADSRQGAVRLCIFGDRLLRLINSTFTTEWLQRMYPTIPDPPLPPSTNLSAFVGLYTHPAYPPLNITDSDGRCPGDLLPPLSNYTKPVKLCITSLFDRGSSSYTPVKIMHVSGDFWVIWSRI
jgi:hypothetical protein